MENDSGQEDCTDFFEDTGNRECDNRCSLDETIIRTGEVGSSVIQCCTVMICMESGCLGERTSCVT